MLSVYLKTILYYHQLLFIDIERENIHLVSIHCVLLLDLLATINLHYIYSDLMAYFTTKLIPYNVLLKIPLLVPQVL